MEGSRTGITHLPSPQVHLPCATVTVHGGHSAWLPLHPVSPLGIICVSAQRSEVCLSVMVRSCDCHEIDPALGLEVRRQR